MSAFPPRLESFPTNSWGSATFFPSLVTVGYNSAFTVRTCEYLRALDKRLNPSGQRKSALASRHVAVEITRTAIKDRDSAIRIIIISAAKHSWSSQDRLKVPLRLSSKSSWRTKFDTASKPNVTLADAASRRLGLLGQRSRYPTSKQILIEHSVCLLCLRRPRNVGREFNLCL